MLNQQSWTADRGGPQAWVLVQGLTTPHRKKDTVRNPLDKPRNWTDYLVRPQQMNRPKDMRFGRPTCNVTSLYRTGTVTLVAREVPKYRLNIVGVQEVRLDGNGISPIGDYMLYYGKGNNHNQEQGSLYIIE